MKITTKLMSALFFAAALFFTTNVKAQTAEANKWRLGFGLEGGLPNGDAHNTSNFELGATARLQYSLSSKFSFTLTSGYYEFFGKTVTVIAPTPNGVTGPVNEKLSNVGIIPVKAGIKDFLSKHIYFGAEAGAGFETNTGGGTKLLLSPALGWANSSWDVGVRYENFSGQGSNFGVLGLRLAYGFTL